MRGKSLRHYRLIALYMCLTFAVGAQLAAGADARLADAVMSGDKDILHSLPDDRANINTPQPDGTTALHWAVRHDDVATARRGADTPGRAATARLRADTSAPAASARLTLMARLLSARGAAEPSPGGTRVPGSSSAATRPSPGAGHR